MNRLLSMLANRQDILLVIFLGLVVFMIVIPLPTWLIDAMITLNLMLAILILMVGLYLNSAADFTTLPAIILMSTLFRLAISISTTRLILLNADAGQIVETFGNFVAGGSLVVGIILFLIITVVQFIVITKGAERVAEVGARFSLDAMPGKQMAIDSDLRTGELTMETARKRRSTIQTESQFYGAMDGTMKFVKGDSIAGIVIILVNILGGMVIGVASLGMSFAEAAGIYSILTIGDGLVSQIPALIIAISAGSIVTRVNSDDSVDLGNDIARQLSANQNSLRFTALLLLLFGLVPGFPTLTFFVAAGIVFGLGILVTRKQRAKKDSDTALADQARVQEASTSPIQLIVPKNVFDKLDLAEFEDAQLKERQVLLANLGVSFPSFAIEQDISDAEAKVIRLTIEGVAVLYRDIPTDVNFMLALDMPETLAGLGATQVDIPPPWSMRSATWIDPSLAPAARDADIPVLSFEQVLARFVAYALPHNIEHFLGVQETRLLLNRANRRFPDLVEGVLEDVKLPAMAMILQNLVREQISIRDMRSVLEALAKWGPIEKEPEMLLEYVRMNLAKQISSQYSPDARVIYAVVFSPESEDALRDSTQVTNAGSYLILDADKRDALVHSVNEGIKPLGAAETRPVIVTNMDIRRVLQRFLRTNEVFAPVISNQDIAPDYRLQIVKEVGF